MEMLKFSNITVIFACFVLYTTANANDCEQGTPRQRQYCRFEKLYNQKLAEIGGLKNFSQQDFDDLYQQFEQLHKQNRQASPSDPCQECRHFLLNKQPSHSFQYVRINTERRNYGAPNVLNVGDNREIQVDKDDVNLIMN